MRPNDLEECIRQFIKTLMGNTIPISWLFLFQPLWKIRFDGAIFWSIYLTFTVIVTIGIWFVNRTTPDVGTGKEVFTPVFGFITATFQPIVFLGTLAVYYAVS